MKHILIIDDDPGVLDALKMVFSKDNFEVTVYTNGNAILANNYTTPDIFIIDKQLSGVDGLDICRHIKANPGTQQVPIIVLSASPNLHKVASAAGADAFLEKPFGISALREVVQRCITQNKSN